MKLKDLIVPVTIKTLQADGKEIITTDSVYINCEEDIQDIPNNNRKVHASDFCISQGVKGLTDGKSVTADIWLRDKDEDDDVKILTNGGYLTAFPETWFHSGVCPIINLNFVFVFFAKLLY